MIGQAFLRLGATLAAAFFRTLGFLITGVIAPFFLGVTRQSLRAVWGVHDEEETMHPPRNQLGFALLAGLLWVVTYLVLRGLLQLVGGALGLLFGELLPAGPSFLEPLLTIVLVFVAGSLVGVWIFSRDEGFFARW
jgi:hypothetical protein